MSAEFGIYSDLNNMMIDINNLSIKIIFKNNI